MITWIGSSEDRIISWRKYRQLLEEMTLPDAVASIKEVWTHCPCLKKLSIDQNNSEQWPGPWELMTNTAFCPLTQILGVFYTISLTTHNSYGIVLEIFDDTISSYYQVNIGNGEQIILLRGKQLVNTKLETRNNLQRFFWDTNRFHQ